MNENYETYLLHIFLIDRIQTHFQQSEAWKLVGFLLKSLLYIY